MIIDYEITKCYVIDFAEYNLIMKTLKRSLNWIKLNLRKLIITIITFIVIMTSAVVEKVYVIEIIIHNTPEVRFSIFVMIDDFPSL